MYKRTKVDRLARKFSQLVRDYLASHNMDQGQLAARVGLNRSHVCSLVNGNRSLSTYYVWHFLRGGVFKVDELYDGQPESKTEEEFWEKEKVAENYALLGSVVNLRKKGIEDEELKSLLDAISREENTKEVFQTLKNILETLLCSKRDR